MFIYCCFGVVDVDFKNFNLYNINAKKLADPKSYKEMRYKILIHGFGLIIFLTLIIFYLFILQKVYHPNYDLRYYAKLPISDIPLIKAGTKFFDSSSLLENMNIKTGLLQDCPKICYFIDEKRVKLKTKVDITLLHVRDLKDEVLDEIKYTSSMNALGTIVLYSLESPLYAPVNWFNENFIITYQSNFYGLSRKYDYFERITEDTNAEEIWSDEQIISAIKAKTKGLLIFLSNCYTFSSREYLIEAISQYLPITVYGSCSKINCNSTCEEAAIKEHAFYLAFENSICNEYVTEKFWRIKDLIVPIVLSRNATANVSPEGSFIAVDDFSSVEKMVEYLKYLMNNMDEYKKYFSWTKQYKKTHHKPNLACNLCKFAWELRTNPSHAKTMLPTYDQWVLQSQCRQNYALSLMTSGELNKISFLLLYKKLLFLIMPLLFLFFAVIYAYRNLFFNVAKITMHNFSKK